MFLAKLKPQEVREPDGTVRYMVDENAAEETRLLRQSAARDLSDRARDRPPRRRTRRAARRAEAEVGSAGSAYMTAAAESKPAPAPARASTESRRHVLQPVRLGAEQLGSAADSAATMTKPVSPPAAKAAAPAPTPKPAARPQPAATAAAQPKPQPAAQAQEPTQTAQAAPAPTPARPIGGERREPDERRGADRSDRQLRSALGRDRA